MKWRSFCTDRSLAASLQSVAMAMHAWHYRHGRKFTRSRQMRACTRLHRDEPGALYCVGVVVMWGKVWGGQDASLSSQYRVWGLCPRKRFKFVFKSVDFGAFEFWTG